MVKLYVEGGGDSAALKTACRKGFTTFITNAGIAKRPRVVACGGRQDAYAAFCISIANGEAAILLVDSEEAVAPQLQNTEPVKWQPWAHLKQRAGDGWDKPDGSDDMDCHLMVQCMENWFLADRNTLKKFFGQKFRESDLPAATNPVEGVVKTQVYSSLEKATRDCKSKGKYGKGEHSFDILEIIDAKKVTAASPWAKRFILAIKKKLDA